MPPGTNSHFSTFPDVTRTPSHLLLSRYKTNMRKPSRNLEELSADDLLKQMEEPRRKRRKIAEDQLDSDEGEDGPIRIGNVDDEQGESSDDEDLSERDEANDSDGRGVDGEGEDSGEELDAFDGHSNVHLTEETSRVPLPSRTRSLAPKAPDKTDSSKASGFAELGASKALIASLATMSIRTPTEVQAACIPPLLAGESQLTTMLITHSLKIYRSLWLGRDCVGNAKTGSGKTIAFALPILQKLSVDPYGIYALILTPTRYLHCQLVRAHLVLMCISFTENLHFKFPSNLPSWALP